MPDRKPEYLIEAQTKDYTDKLGITKPEPLDPYIEAKLKEIEDAVIENARDDECAIVNFNATRAALRPILVQIYQDGHNEGLEDGGAREAEDPEPPEQDECND